MNNGGQRKMKIVRRADRAEGGLTPAEQAQLKDYAAMWCRGCRREIGAYGGCQTPKCDGTAHYGTERVSREVYEITEQARTRPVAVLPRGEVW